MLTLDDEPSSLIGIGSLAGWTIGVGKMVCDLCCVEDTTATELCCVDELTICELRCVDDGFTPEVRTL